MPTNNTDNPRLRHGGGHRVKDHQAIHLVHRGVCVIEELEKRIGHRFQNANILREAVIHTFEEGHVERGARSNTRLAWLGDTVVNLCVSEDLYRLLERFDRAVLDRARQDIVNEDTLALAARSLELDRFLTSSRGAPIPEDQMSTGTLEKAFEAIVGAVYLDGGASAAWALVRKSLGSDQASSFDSFGRYIGQPGQ